MRPLAAIHYRGTSRAGRLIEPCRTWVWLSVAAALLCLPQADLQADQFVLQPPAGGFRVGGKSQVLVGVLNESDRQGLQFDLVYDPKLVRPVQVSGVGRLSETHLHHSISPPGRLHVVAYERRGNGWKLPSGTDPIVALTFEVLDTPAAGALQLAVVHGITVAGAGEPLVVPPATIEVAVESGEELQSPEPTEAGAPARFALYQNAPNPFSGSTSFRFDIARAGHARIVIYDLSGRSVRVLANGKFAPGQHTVTWSGTARGGRIRPGIYFCVMEAAGFRAVKKLIRLE